MTLPVPIQPPKFPIFDMQTISKVLTDIRARMVNTGTVIAGEDYSTAVDDPKKIPANRHRFSLEVSDREFRHAQFQARIAENALFRRHSGAFGEDFYQPTDAPVGVGPPPTDPGPFAAPDFILGRCVTGLTGAGSRVFMSRIITSWTGFTTAHVRQDAQLNGGTIAYFLVTAALPGTPVPVNTDTVVAAIPATGCYWRIVITNGASASPDLRSFWSSARLGLAPVNASAYEIGYNKFAVR
ncbi:MAG TPA: hypothetical protein VJB38_12400 [Bacteroidota bacterium]|nr:hypothetical protein [Bacteroidota bacterium]